MEMPKFSIRAGVMADVYKRQVYREVKTYLKDVLPKEASKEDADGSQQ